MSSKRNILHEFQFPEASRNRKKIDIDGFRMIEASKDESRQKEEEEKTNGLESKYDLRKSLAWDNAFFTSPGVLDPEELFETLNIDAGDKGPQEPSDLPSESMAASRIDECIARRSLAWDVAFFTSAGVLNPEELSLVNNGYRKSETVTHILPEVEQEFLKSTESNSTLDSDYSLSSLEIDLFDDMRTSMQKSSKTSDLVNSSCKLQSQTGIPNPRFSKRLDTTSTRVKPFPASRRPKTTADGVRKTAKEAINPSKSQHGTRAGEHEPSSSSLKLSKAYDQANPFSPGASKRASMGTNQMKMNNKIRKVLSGQSMSKKHCIGDRGTPSPEPSSSPSHIVSKDLLGSVCGHNASIVKSPSSLRRKNDSAASDSDARTPTRSLTQHKSKLIESSQPTSLQSTPKSPSASLLTSTGCWSSESSASLNHVNNDASQGSDTDNCSNDELVLSGSKETGFPYHDVGRFTKGSCHLPSSVSREIKPSGLRLPSPKIGFFEVGNSRELTLHGVKFHSGLQNSSKTRTGTNHLNGTPTRARSRLPSPRTSPRASNLKEKKLGSLQNGTQSSRDIKFNYAAKLEGKKGGTIKSSPAATSPAETDLSCESSDGYGSKTDSSGSYVIGDDKGKIQPKRKEHVSQMGEKSSQDQNKEIIALNRDEKENLFSFKSQVDVLTKQIEAIDVNGDLVIEF
ncbi:hypothetical protein HRI_004863400 [Hibiscus trionum]|uniref:Uncharacterized protein n=1 Tax=Hibiscus trionum TaxID=183268 RepID=A0A9W7JF19_HIBTR|nr:hypothetical protein HRI_004863400 [Hibiscus trionum]